MIASSMLPSRRLLLAAATVAALSGASLPALATSTDRPEPGAYQLKDGTMLYVAKNGWMRMFTAEGQRLQMPDGVPMQTRDGKVIVMKEDQNWKQLRLRGTLRPGSH